MDEDQLLRDAVAARRAAQDERDAEAWFAARGTELEASRALERAVAASRKGRFMALFGRAGVAWLVMRRKRRAYG